MQVKDPRVVIGDQQLPARSQRSISDLMALTEISPLAGRAPYKRRPVDPALKLSVRFKHLFEGEGKLRRPVFFQMRQRFVASSTPGRCPAATHHNAIQIPANFSNHDSR
jgi:hypothetical protein